MRTVAIALLLMTALASAGPRAPEGWPGDHDGADVVVYSGPNGARYLVVTTEDAKGSLSEQAASTEQGLREVGAHIIRHDVREVDGQLIADTIAEAKGGVHVHARTVAALQGSQPARIVVVAGTCSATGAEELAQCEAVLPFVSVPVDPRYAPSDYTNFYVMGGVIGGGTALVMVLVALWTRARRRRDLAQSSALVEGEHVTVSGKVRAVDKTLEAPLSGKRCVLYRTHARVFSRASVPKLLSEPFELETVPFMIDTPRGVVRVDAPGMQIAITPERAIGVPEERMAAFLERHRVRTREGIDIDEIVVEPGQTVTIEGVLRACRDETSTAERGYRDELPIAYELVDAVTLVRAW